MRATVLEGVTRRVRLGLAALPDGHRPSVERMRIP
jgi:hypothetical protein